MGGEVPRHFLSGKPQVTSFLLEEAFDGQRTIELGYSLLLDYKLLKGEQY